MSLSSLSDRRRRSDTAPPCHPDWVLAAPFRAHVRHLLATTGLPWRALAVQAGVEPTLVRALLQGRGGRPMKRLHPESAQRLLTLTPDGLQRLARTHVPVGEVPSVLRALVSAGLAEQRLARWLRLPAHELEALCTGSVLYCTALTAWLTEALAQAHALDTLAA